MSQRPIDVNKLIGERLRVRRQLLGLTQKEVADRVGLTFQMISKYENGTSTITLYRLLRFADELEVPVDYLIRGIGHATEMPDDMVSVLADRQNSEMLKLFVSIEDPSVRGGVVQMLRGYHHHQDASRVEEDESALSVQVRLG